MSPRAAWIACAVAGLATLAVSIGFGMIPDLKPCGPTDGAGAVVALELVRSHADLLDLFGQGVQPCADRLATAQVRALWLDMLVFIPAYAAFLLLGVRAADRNWSRLAIAAAPAILLAGLLDEVEGVILLQMAPVYAGPPSLYDALFWTVRPKFALLGAGEVLIALLLVRRTLLAKIAAVPVALGGLASLWFLFTDPRNPLMMEGHRWAWTALLIVAILGAIRPALVKAPEQV